MNKRKLKKAALIYHAIKMMLMFVLKVSTLQDMRHFKCLKNLGKAASKIQVHSTTTNDTQIKGAQQLKEVNEVTKFINKNFEEIEADWRKREQQTGELKGTINGLNVRLDKVNDTIVDFIFEKRMPLNTNEDEVKGNKLNNLEIK